MQCERIRKLISRWHRDELGAERKPTPKRPRRGYSKLQSARRSGGQRGAPPIAAEVKIGSRYGSMKVFEREVVALADEYADGLHEAQAASSGWRSTPTS